MADVAKLRRLGPAFAIEAGLGICQRLRRRVRSLLAAEVDILGAVVGALSVLCIADFIVRASVSEGFLSLASLVSVSSGAAASSGGDTGCLNGRLTVRDNLDLGAFPLDDKTKIPANIAMVFELFPILKERQSQIARSQASTDVKSATLS